MLDIKLLSNDFESQYSNYIETKNDANIYHTLNWRDLLRITFKYSPMYLVATETSEIKGVLPLFLMRNFSGQKKIITLPFSHCVKPLYDSDRIGEHILKFSEGLANEMKATYIEIKSPIERKNWKIGSAYHSSVLDLSPSIELIWDKIKSSTRRNIRKAKRNKISIKIGDQLKDYLIFYELMIETRQRQGSPPYSKAFFKNIFSLIDKTKRILFIAYLKEKPVAGIIMLQHGATAIYAYGASVNNKEILRYRPNELLFWSAINYAKEKNKKVFDFGITPKGHDGLLRFKKQWGTITSEMEYSFYLNRTSSIPRIKRSGLAFSIASTTFRRMPKTLFKILGPKILQLLG